jgi:diguanylate cyclase (GGDEF)-like protein
MTSREVSGRYSKLSVFADDEEEISVLLVEDSLPIRMQIRQFLALVGHVTLIETGTLAEARAILEEQAHTIFCAILDLTLPDASGLDTVETVSAYEVPIIVLTVSVDPYLRQAILDMRVVDYMVKAGVSSIEDVAYLIGRLRQNQRMKVLVVDDSKVFCIYVSRLLEQYRYPIVIAHNGRDALELMDANPDIALILTDYHMPEMNGLELVRKIRSKYRREDIAIIALSEINRPELSSAMLKAGANDFLLKKFQVEEFYCRVVQNTNMVHFVRELRDMANRDYLTRLYNRRYLFKAADALYVDACKGKFKIVVAMVDVDLFKSINDKYGHGAGDEALKQIAKVLRREFSYPDIVARYGGEEFVCVLSFPRNLKEIHRFERLRKSIENISLVWKGEKIPITVSIGVTTTLGKSFSSMIEKADRAVFVAKSEGRNRVKKYNVYM